MGWSLSTAPFRRVGLGAHQPYHTAAVGEKRAEIVSVLANILQKTVLAVQVELLLI